jgi:hypothetical protein
MPFALTLTHIPRLRHLQLSPAPSPPPPLSDEPWRQLLAQATDLESQLQILWDGVFLDYLARLSPESLETAIEHGPLPTEHLLWSAWHGVTQTATRAPLLALLHSAAAQTFDALQPGLAQVLEAPALRFDVPTPALGAFIDQYVGAQLVAVTDTTRQAIRQIVRDNVEAGRTIREQAKAIRSVVGLTPRQAASVEGLRQQLTEQGVAPSQIERQVEVAADRARRLRAQQIARTESMRVANQAQAVLHEQAQAQGYLPVDQKKQWLITPDRRLCPICAAIPGMNPGGVLLGEPFETPIGPLDMPPAHPACRCTLTLVLA